MLQLFRNFFKSKVGIVVTLAFLGLIAFAFASSDVANTGTFGGVTGGDRVAVVGDRRIDASDLSIRAADALNRVRQENPTLTMESFIASDGLQSTLDSIISRAALAELGTRHGLRAGQRLVDSEIYTNPNLLSLDGSFDSDAFRNALRQQGISEEMLREDLAMGIFTRQLAQPIALAPRMPMALTRRYAQLRLETRSGSISALVAAAYAPEGDPTEEQLRTYYNDNSDNFRRPERRVIRYASFGEEAFSNLPAPTDEQIAERFERDALLYSERETRAFTQLIATTQAAAQAIIDEVNGGVSLEASARSKGLSTTAVAPTTREDYANSSSQAVADAAFAAAQGQMSAPAQGSLGWYIVRADQIDRQASRSMQQVRTEISAQLATEQRRDAMNEATSRIEDELSSGRSLSEVAEELGIEVRSTRPVMATGQIYGAQETAPQELAPIFSVAFQMEEANPQLAEAVPGELFMLFDVAQITPSAVAPFAEIQDDLVTAWRADEGMTAAGVAANRVLARLEEGSSMAEAIRAEDVNLPTPDNLTISRAEVEASGQIARPIALFFSMAEGTRKSLDDPAAGAWFVVALDDISAPEVEEGSEVLLTTNAQLTPFLPDEYTEQLIRAVESEVEVEINQVAVDGVEAQLTGRTN